ncbi:hypothetical protein AAHA92_02623 [Salvia divinorum]|uniref:Uncharacterized protein n=1 Tax=Salvia divinorum TaxID=28513 RepID=A0ABD1IH43_SALDI
MRISELTENRNEPDAMPEKSGCSGSAKINHTISSMPAEEVNATSVKNGRTYGTAAFAKIGKAVATPVRVVYRIVPSMSDDAETLISVYPANFPLNTGLRESDDGQKFICGQDAGTPLKNECRDSYKFGFLTSPRMSYTATVEVFYRIGQWMASPEAKSTMIMYITILAKNARFQHDYKFIDGKAAFLIILANTLIEILNEHITQAKEKAEEHVSGSQELIIGVEMHGKAVKSASEDGHDWFSAAYKSLKDILGVIPLNEILVFMFISDIDELVVLVLRELFGIDLVNESGFSGSATEGRKKKMKQMHKY